MIWETIKHALTNGLMLASFIVVYVQVIVRFIYYCWRKTGINPTLEMNAISVLILTPFLLIITVVWTVIDFIWERIKQSALFLADKEYYARCQRENSFIVSNQFFNSETVHTDNTGTE